jgi:hypothetical protein
MRDLCIFKTRMTSKRGKIEEIMQSLNAVKKNKSIEIGGECAGYQEVMLSEVTGRAGSAVTGLTGLDFPFPGNEVEESLLEGFLEPLGGGFDEEEPGVGETLSFLESPSDG